MKIGLIHSLDFAREALEIKEKLEEKGHSISLCYSVSKIKEGKLSVQKILDLKNSGEFFEYTISKDLIKWNYERIKEDEAVLVINLTKKGIDNYIGGNTFLEMGFAYVLGKKVFLWQDIPEMIYTDEIKAMKPIILNEDLNSIK